MRGSPAGRAKRAVTLGHLVRDIPGMRIIGDPSALVCGVTNVSRDVAPGDLFVAIRGREFDGHRFVADAVARGAGAVVVQEPVHTDVPQIVTDDSRAALAQLAAALFEHPSADLRVIGVTGTDGKTTTSHLMTHVLECAGRRTGRIGSLGAVVAGRAVTLNEPLTTPQPHEVHGLLRTMADSGVADVVMEASSQGLSMRRLDMVAFDAAVVTNITAEHLEDHGDFEAYRTAKAALVDRVVQQGGPVVLNRDDPGSEPLAALVPAAQLITFGIGPSSDIRADHVDLGAAGSKFTLHTPAGTSRVQLPLPGAFNLSNALAVAATTLTLGLDLATVVQGLDTAPTVPGRMIRIDEGQPFWVYVDYAHTIAAVGAVLGHLRSLHPEGRLIAVCGSGLHPDYWKRPLLAQQAVRHADLVVFCAGDARFDPPDEVVADFAAGARAAGAVPGQDFLSIPDRQEAITFAVAAAGPGDVVAILGKGHENVTTQRDRRESWSEEQAVRAAIAGAFAPLRTAR